MPKAFQYLTSNFSLSQKLDSRGAADMDLKLADLLRYYSRDTQACKDLLYRRSRSLANLENANKELDKARSRGKNVQQVLAGCL